MSDLKQTSILLVEDDPGHAVLIQKNLKRGGVTSDIIVLDNGRKAVDFLFRRGDYASDRRPLPDLILLDLNLPVLDGYQALNIIKGDERVRRIPIIVLTTTDNPAEVCRCYDLGCNVYITKPVDYGQFSHTMRSLGAFLSLIRTSG